MPRMDTMTDEPITLRDLLSELTLGEKLWLLVKIYCRKLIDALILPFIIIGDWIFQYNESSAYTPEQEEVVAEAWDRTVRQIEGKTVNYLDNYPHLNRVMNYTINGRNYWGGWSDEGGLKLFIDNYRIIVHERQSALDWFTEVGFPNPEEMVRYYEEQDGIHYEVEREVCQSVI